MISQANECLIEGTNKNWEILGMLQVICFHYALCVFEKLIVFFSTASLLRIIVNPNGKNIRIAMKNHKIFGMMIYNWNKAR